MDEHRKTRRRHGAQFKSQDLTACREPGASVAGVALSFGLNANLIRQWLRGRGVKQTGGALAVPTVARHASADAQQFVPLALPAAAPTSSCDTSAPGCDIRIELRRGALQVSVSWPPSVAADCGAWLRELLRTGVRVNF